jgi:aminoglycoside phosphotransferase (APT) family kinase protein
VYPHLAQAKRNQIRNYLSRAIKNDHMLSLSPVIIHQDFGFHNILVNLEDKEITGVLDFGLCSIGDPVLDVFQEILPYYKGEVDPGWQFRCDYYLRTAALEDLLAIFTSNHPIHDCDAILARKMREIQALWL